MKKLDIIQSILKDSNYKLSLFSESEVKALNDRIETKRTKGKKTYSVRCVVRDKSIQLGPEEIVRQLYATKLINHYGYPKNRIAFEYSVVYGREKKLADIVILDKDRPDDAYIVIEFKKPKSTLAEGKKQLLSYCNATGVPMAYGQRRRNIVLSPQNDK